MQNGEIPGSAVTASTEYNGNYIANNGRLWFSVINSNYYGWLSSPADTNQYLQVTFKKWTKVTGIASQGRGNAGQWVKSYTLLYTYDGIFFRHYKQSGRTAVHIKAFYLLYHFLSHGCDSFNGSSMYPPLLL